MTTEMKETICLIEELKNTGLTQDQAVQLIMADAARSKAASLDKIEKNFYRVIDPMAQECVYVEVDNAIEKAVDRMSDRLADGMDALREDAKTGKVFIKGEFSSYNIR